MPRRPLPLGTYGEIWYTNGDRTAKANYRDFDGKTRIVERTGKSKTAATNALKAALRDRQDPAGRDLPVTRDTRLRDLLTKWIDHHKSTPMPSGQMRASATIDYYEDAIKRLTERIGELRVYEATTARLEVALGEGSQALWRADRKTLGLAFGYAVRMGAVPVNPVRETTTAPGSRKKARALTVDEVREVRARIAEWQGASRFGPKRMPELGHIVDVMLGTGLRISDTLAITWANVDLDADPPTLTARIQKSHGEELTFTLPGFTADALREQRARGIPSEGDLVFPTRNGTMLGRQNVTNRWREARDAKDDTLAWVSPHNFRKTAATLIEREYGVDRASKQLGHSGVAVTERHYIERAKTVPDNRGALDKLAREQ